MSNQQIKVAHIWRRVQGLSIHFRITNNVDTKNTLPIVLVHGLSVSSRYMLPTMHALAPYFPLYAPDLPGFGKSDKPSHILTIPELADSLAECMRVMGIKKAVLLGNSLGCQIIVNLAVRYPHLASHLILVGPTTDPKGKTLLKELKRLLIDMTREPISYLPVVIKEYSDAGVKRTIRTIQYGFKDNVEEKASQIPIPTLIVRGGKDPIVPQYWVEELHNLFPDSKLEIVPQAGHAVNFNSPDKLAGLVKTFLQKR